MADASCEIQCRDRGRVVARGLRRRMARAALIFLPAKAPGEFSSLVQEDGLHQPGSSHAPRFGERLDEALLLPRLWTLGVATNSMQELDRINRRDASLHQHAPGNRSRSAESAGAAETTRRPCSAWSRIS